MATLQEWWQALIGTANPPLPPDPRTLAPGRPYRPPTQEEVDRIAAASKGQPYRPTPPPEGASLLRLLQAPQAPPTQDEIFARWLEAMGGSRRLDAPPDPGTPLEWAQAMQAGQPVPPTLASEFRQPSAPVDTRGATSRRVLAPQASHLPGTGPPVTTADRLRTRARDVLASLQQQPLSRVADLAGASPFTNAQDVLGGANPLEVLGFDLAGVPLAGVQAAGRGLYSRVDDAVSLVPKKGAHANKVASILKANASAEELAYREVPGFLKRQGDRPVTPEALAAHLLEHPAPTVKVKTLGGPRADLIAQQRAVNTRLATMRNAAFNDPADWHGLEPSDRANVSYWAMQAAKGDADALRKVQGVAADDDHLKTLLAMGRLQNESHALRDQIAAAPTARHAAHVLPGGEDYRETLLQLPEQSPQALPPGYSIKPVVGNPNVKFTLETPDGSGYALGAMTAEQAYPNALAVLHDKGVLPPPSNFRHDHFPGETNIVAHTRADERTLPVTGMRPLPEIERIIQDTVGARFPEHIASGGPQRAVSQGLISHDEAALYGHSRGFTNYPTPPVGPRGRFLEEVQSDWHQKARDQVTRTLKEIRTRARLPKDTPRAEILRHASPLERTIVASGGYQQQGQHVTAFYRTSKGEQVPLGHGATEEAARASIAPGWDTIPGVTIEFEARPAMLNEAGVPDAPFKESWPDLALKQQLLEAADDPNAQWLGFTSGQTQADRYDLSKQISRIDFEPAGRGDYSMGELVAYDHNGKQVIREGGLEPTALDEYIGKDAADNLRREIASREWDYSQWTVERDDTTKAWQAVDPNGEVIEDLGTFGTEAGARRELESYLDNMRDNDATATISGLDLKVGGEGMRYFYDELLPKRLEKILSKFGVKVERGTLTRPRADIEAELNALEASTTPVDRAAQKRLMDELGAATDDPMWFVRLTPDIKERLKKEGLPLLLALMTAGVVSQAEVEDDVRAHGEPSGNRYHPGAR